MHIIKAAIATALVVMALPAVAQEPAKLDRNEISVALTRGGYRRMLMLCGREPVLEQFWSLPEVAQAGVANPLMGSAEQMTDELEALLKSAVRQQMCYNNQERFLHRVRSFGGCRE